MAKQYDKLWVDKEFKIALDEIKIDFQRMYGKRMTTIEASKILARMLKNKKSKLYFEDTFDFHL
jgi:hypothetical protein